MKDEGFIDNDIDGENEDNELSLCRVALVQFLAKQLQIVLVNTGKIYRLR